MSNYPYANYTISYKEFATENAEWIKATFAMTTEERTTAFINMMASVWNLYEIAGETIGDMKLMLEDSFNEHKYFYEKLLDTYDKESEQYDLATATSALTTRSTENYSHAETTDKGVSVTLPHKPIEEDKIYDYPDSADKSSRLGDSNSTDSQKVESKDNRDYLRQRAMYINQVRNLYREFAYAMRDCFIHIF